MRLVSFALHWIKAEIHEYILRNWRLVKVATTKAQRKLFFNLRSMKQERGAETRGRAIARELGVNGRVIGVQRRDTSEITIVEEYHPFRIYRLNLGLLGERRRDQPNQHGNHHCNPAHDQLRSVLSISYVHIAS